MNRAKQILGITIVSILLLPACGGFTKCDAYTYNEEELQKEIIIENETDDDLLLDGEHELS